MRGGSLFTGGGGMDLGFEQAGFEICYQVEIDDFCNKVLEKHWPHVPRHRDIRDFHEFASVDCIFGGFPCKQTSTAAAIHGRRSGLAGRDSGLWHEMVRVIRRSRSQWVVVENTAGAKTWSEEIEGGLADAGYLVQRLELEAGDFGAPHRRRRVFWIANSHGQRPPFAWRPEPPAAASDTRRAVDRDAWHPPLPRTLRVADGVPGGLDRRKRIEVIGNAVYPPMARHIARCIMSAAAKESEVGK